MGKRFALLLLLSFFFLSAGAQNNPFDLDDECYACYLEAEALVGKEGFLEANDKLLHKALELSLIHI